MRKWKFCTESTRVVCANIVLQSVPDRDTFMHITRSSLMVPAREQKDHVAKPRPWTIVVNKESSYASKIENCECLGTEIRKSRPQESYVHF